MTFILAKTLDLSDVGPEWEGCFLTLREPTTEEVQRFGDTDADEKEQVNKVLRFLEKCFIHGKGYDGKEIVDIKKDDLSQLPISIYQKAFLFLLGKVETPLNTTKKDTKER